MRRQDWLDRLQAYLHSTREWHFDPVRANCAVFAMGVIEAVQGEPAAAVLERLQVDLPDTEMGVARVLASFGGVRGMAEAYCGAPARTDVLNAQRGDLAVLDGDGGDTLGVVEGGGVICVSSKAGISRFPLTDAKGFWRLE